jgi:hypothetical protein
MTKSTNNVWVLIIGDWLMMGAWNLVLLLNPSEIVRN